MGRIGAHFTRVFIGGVIALLPIGGLVLSVAWLESSIAGSYLSRQAWYFPGLGIVVAAVFIYAVGLTVTSLLGRWLWSRCDAVLERLPLLGRLYATLKQIVGYGEGTDAIFKGVVFVPSGVGGAVELGLVTGTCMSEGREKLTVFVPLAANPTAGRLLLADAADVTATSLPVSEALKMLVSIGAAASETPAPAPGGGVIPDDRPYWR